MSRLSILTVAAVLTAVPVVTPRVASACGTCMAVGRDLHAASSFGGLPVPTPSTDSFLGHPVATGAFSLLVPALNSRPSAPAKLYLDFDGDFVPTWGGFNVGQTPAFSIDDDASTFSSLELQKIDEVFQRVAEHFSPFDVNVTTVEPTFFDTNWSRIVIGGNGSWYPQTVGGLAFVASHQVNFLPRGGWVFSRNLLPGDPQHASFVAAAASHEAGHVFGLEHQSTYGPNGELLDPYNRGDEFKAPLMGSSYRKRGLWWNGPNEISASTIQDDLAVLTSGANRFGYRPDDHADLPSAATPMLNITPDTVFGAGVIERMSDVDYFSFETLAGTVTFNLLPAPYGPMLDASLALYDAAGSLLEMVNTASLGETLTQRLDGGAYRLAVLSRGFYGDIGQYSLTGTIIPVPEPASVVGLLFAGGIILRRRHRPAWVQILR